MDTIALVLVLAVTAEALVEYAKSAGRMIAQRQRDGGGWFRPGVTQLLVIGLSVALCSLAGADLYAGLGVRLRTPEAGYVLTGILCSRGANYVSDLVGAVGRAGSGVDDAGIGGDKK